MDIKVLGMGCAKCKALEKTVHDAVAELGVNARVEHVTDPRQIASYGVMATPGLVVNGVVKSSGRLPSKLEVVDWLKAAAE